MSDMAEVPTGHPLRDSWERYKETDEYRNVKRWALQPEHVDGSLWAAFSEGFSARVRIAEKEKTELVEAAFREGHFKGRCGGEMSDEDDDWKGSLHRAILAKHEQENQDDEA